MTDQTLTDLGHNNFRSLTNHGSHWTLEHLTKDGTTAAAITDKWLDRLLETWGEVIEELDADKTARDCGLVCACGSELDGSHDHATCGEPIARSECPDCHGTGMCDTGGTREDGKFIEIPCERCK